jgi:hypothetical protein
MVPLEPADIEENREGRLSAAQRAALEAEVRGFNVVGWLTLTGLWTFFVCAATIPNTHSVARAITIIVVFVGLLLALCVWLRRVLARRALANIAKYRVASETGQLQYARRSQYGPRYYVSFGGETLAAPLDMIKPHRKELEARPHRVYYIAPLGRVLFIEPVERGVTA